VKLSSALIAAFLLAACGPTVVVGGDSLYDDGNQGAPNCPFSATYNGQPGVPGDPCTNAAADCSPACCECANGVDSYWASECSGGTCTNDGAACNDAPSGSLCQ
jgi:hypothetical protein